MILNLRPTAHRESFHRAFAPLGDSIVDCDMLRPEPLWTPPLDNFFSDAVILTSPIAAGYVTNAVALFRLPIFAVGETTAAAARRAGFARVHTAGGDAQSLAQVFGASDARRALYLSAEEPSSPLERQFPGRIRRIAVYRMVARETLPPSVVESLAAAPAIVAPVFSRRTATAFAAAVARSRLPLSGRTVAVGISRQSIAIQSPPWRRSVIADEPSQAAVAAAVGRLVAQNRRH